MENAVDDVDSDRRWSETCSTCVPEETGKLQLVEKKTRHKLHSFPHNRALFVCKQIVFSKTKGNPYRSLSGPRVSRNGCSSLPRKSKTVC